MNKNKDIFSLVETNKTYKKKDIDALVHYCNLFIYVVQSQQPGLIDDKKNVMYWINKQLKKMKANWK